MDDFLRFSWVKDGSASDIPFSSKFNSIGRGNDSIASEPESESCEEMHNSDRAGRRTATNEYFDFHGFRFRLRSLGCSP
jgi:hypothetical protein